MLHRSDWGNNAVPLRSPSARAAEEHSSVSGTQTRLRAAVLPARLPGTSPLMEQKSPAVGGGSWVKASPQPKAARRRSAASSRLQTPSRAAFVAGKPGQRLPLAMNCSEALRLRTLLSHLLRQLPGGANASRGAAAPAGDDAYLYILLIMIFYGCLAGGLILAYTRSRKRESKHDPYHVYIERDWSGRPEGADQPL
ncbi:unnamed protein product [Lepidochelys olivacea]